jgi:hypothetical protein
MFFGAIRHNFPILVNCIKKNLATLRVLLPRSRNCLQTDVCSFSDNFKHLKSVSSSVDFTLASSITSKENLNFLMCIASSVTTGRCCDQNFLRFSPIFCEKQPFFSKTDVVIILQKLAVVYAKTPNFSPNFSAKIFKNS